jgi:hypothetical protein
VNLMVMKNKSKAAAAFAASGTIVGGLAVVVNLGDLSSAFVLGITATQLGLLSGFLYLGAVLGYLAI